MRGEPVCGEDRGNLAAEGMTGDHPAIDVGLQRSSRHRAIQHLRTVCAAERATSRQLDQERGEPRCRHFVDDRRVGRRLDERAGKNSRPVLDGFTLGRNDQ